MFWLNVILLILMGALGVAGWLKSRSPQLAGPMAAITGVEGWIGLVGLVWGLYSLINLLLHLGLVTVAPLSFIIGLASALVVIALGLLLSLSMLKQFTSGATSRNLSLLAARVAPFKMLLGFICLGLAAYSLIRLVI